MRRPRAIATAAAAGGLSIAALFGLSQGGGTIDVFVGSTPTPVGGTCTGANVTTGTFASRVSGAAAGDVLCLSAGSYGTFSGASKSSPGVTLKPAAGVAQSSVTMAVDWSPATWLIVDNVTVTELGIGSTSSNVTVKNSTMTGYNEINQGSFNSSSILLDNDDFTLSRCPLSPSDCDAGAQEGRLTIVNTSGTTNPSGIVVKNSKFHGNCADGIQITVTDNAGTGSTIGPGNEFYNLQQNPPGGVPIANCAPHVDSFQTVSGAGFTVTGNYFHDSSHGFIGYADTVANTTFTNNVVYTPGDEYCVGGGSGNVVTHNTFVGGPNGNIWLCDDTFGNPALLTVWRDNIQWENPGIKVGATYASGSPNHDLCLPVGSFGGVGDTCAGTGSINGTAPTWVGGSAPSTYAGFALAGGSAGKGVASDGTDIGVNP